MTEGRHFVGDTLTDWGAVDGDPAWEVLDDTLLVVTELLANAVAVCAGPLQLVVDGHRTNIRLAVWDDNPSAAEPREAKAGEPGGRGLAIVSALSGRWGQGPNSHGKEVWAEVGLLPGSALGDGCSQ